MQVIKISDLDYRSILIQNYKELNLSEQELVVLLLIDELSKEKMTLFSGELLSVKMNLNEQDIDEIIVSLMNKNFISYVQKDILVTSLENTYSKIIKLIENKIINNHEDEDTKYKQEALGDILLLLEENMKRALTPLEVEMVSNWLNDGVEKERINQAIEECLMKNSRLTVKQIDRIIIKNLTHTDISQEGISTVSERTKKDIKKAMDIASYDWVNGDENF